MKPVGITEESELLVDSAVRSTGRKSTCEVKCCNGFVRMRYFMVALCWLGFVCSFLVKVNMSIAIVDMVAGSGNDNRRRFNWNSNIQGMILSSFFWGYITMQIPGGIIASGSGTKIYVASGIFLNALLSFFTPICVEMGGSTALICIRVVGGLFMGIVYPANTVIIGKWSPTSERARLLTLSNSGMIIGPLIGFFLGGQIVQTLGWEAIFYFTGSVGILWTVLWTVFASKLPEDNPFISQMEIDYIRDNRGADRPSVPIKEIPWKRLLTSLPYMALLSIHVSNDWGEYTLLTQLPTYLKRIFQVDIKKSGIASGIPYIVQAFTLIISGHLSDFALERSLASTKVVRRCCICLGTASQALFLLLAANSNDFTTAVVFVSLISGFSGVTMAGFETNVFDIAAPNIVGPMVGIANTLGSVAAICAPLVSGMIVVDQSSAEEWKIVFYISASLLVVGCIVFGCFSSGKLELD